MGEIEKVIFADPNIYLGCLFGFWKSEHISTHLSTLVSRVLSSLLVSSTHDVLEFLYKEGGVLESWVNHSDSCIAIDNIGRLMNLEGDYSFQATKWLVEKNIIGLYILRLSREYQNIHIDVAQAVIDILTMSGMESSMFESFDSSENLENLFAFILDPQNHSALLNGMQIVIAMLLLISRTEHSPDHKPPLEDTMPLIVKYSIDHLPDFHKILHEPFATSFVLGDGKSVEPFGAHRTKVVEFIDSLVALEYDSVDAALVKENIFSTIFDLFITYEHNNIFHKTVEIFAFRIFNGTNDGLILSLLSDPYVLHIKLINAYNQKIKKIEPNSQNKPANLPFILSICQVILSAANSKPNVFDILKSSNEWETFKTQILEPDLLEGSKILGGTRPQSSDFESNLQGFSDVVTHNDNEEEEEEEESSLDEDNKDLDEDEIDDLDIPDDTDLPSDTDYRDYDCSQSEVRKIKINNI